MNGIPEYGTGRHEDYLTAEFDYGNPPAEITVTVTAEDIRLGVPGSALCDPICRAVCRFLGTPVFDDMARSRVSIDASGLDIWPDHGNEAVTYELPDEAVTFLETFDITGSADPITFTARLSEGAQLPPEARTA